MTEIIVALIAGGLALVGTVITTIASSKKIDQNIQTAQAVTDTKIEELTREVREHNNFAKRVPVLEQQVETMQHGIERLESFHIGK